MIPTEDVVADTPARKIEAAMARHGLLITAEFVPYSQSRNKDEDRPCLNWKVSLKRMAFIGDTFRPGSERTILTTDFSAGIAHCPSYRNSRRDQSVDEAGAIAWECEHGQSHGLYPAEMGKGFKRQAILPDTASVMHSLVLDYDVMRYPTYEEWAPEVGFDPDSRKGERVYNAGREIAHKMYAALGDKVIEDLRAAGEDL
jgi:hypothetical protein